MRVLSELLDIRFSVDFSELNDADSNINSNYVSLLAFSVPSLFVEHLLLSTLRGR